MPAGRKKGDKLQREAEATRRMSFVTHWLANGRCGKDSAIAVGVSEESAAVMASKWLKLPEIRAEIERVDALARERSQITVDRVVLELGRMAFVDLSEAYDSMGNLKPMKDWPEDVRRACVGFEMTEEILRDGDGVEIGTARLKKVKFHDKTSSMALLLKHFPGGLAPTKVDVKDVTDHGDQMLNFRARRAEALAARAKELAEHAKPDPLPDE